MTEPLSLFADWLTPIAEWTTRLEPCAPYFDPIKHQESCHKTAYPLAVRLDCLDQTFVGLLSLDMKSSKHLVSFTPLDVLHPGICWQSPTFPWISMKRRESCQFLLESSLSVEMISCQGRETSAQWFGIKAVRVLSSFGSISV